MLSASTTGLFDHSSPLLSAPFVYCQAEMLIDLVKSIPNVHTEWTYRPSRPSVSVVVRRARARLSRGLGATWKALMPVFPRRRWLVYFIYSTDGKLDPAHRFTLERMSGEDAALLVVCACPENHSVLQELKTLCDALYWKSQDGWDFSAFALALSELAHLSPGADVLFMNDSVLGPFKPLVPFIMAAPWRLTGFTGNALEENHLQSYAFVLKGIDISVLKALSPVLSTAWSYNAAGPVILQQETRLARLAHRHMSVGAYFYTDGSFYQDLCLNCPEQLLEAGFPFLKRSLFGKFAGNFQDPAAMQALLQRLGHPRILAVTKQEP